MATNPREISTSTAKILLIVRNGGLNGGTEVQAARHLSELCSVGVPTQLLTLRPFRVTRFSSTLGTESLSGRRAAIELLRILRSRPILQMYASRLRLMRLWLFCALPGRAHLISYRSGQEPKLKSGPFIRLAARVMGQVDLFTANSEHVCKQFMIRYPSHQMLYVPNYPSIGEVPRTKAKEPSASSMAQGPKLVSVGNLRQVKDHKTLLVAMAMLQARGLCPSCVVFGSGPTLVLLEHLRDLWGLNVQFPGFSRDWVDIVDPQSIFVHCSISEGFSNAIVEASALQLPVLAAKSPGAVELLGDSVGLFPIGGAVDLADLIENVHNSSVLRTRLINKSRLILDRVNSVKPVESWMRIYRSFEATLG